MSNAIDRLQLIAEIRKRPELWDFRSKEYRPRLTLQKTWEDLALAMGADVDDCKIKWKCLRDAHRVEVKKLELRIREDKLKGSYDPNNEYSCKWAYFEAMEFMRDIQTGPIKLRNSSNRLNLIAEIRKRPAIWDLQSKGNISTRILQQTWKELSRAMGADVDVCKRKWKILRSTYRNEVKKLELRIVEDKFNGSYDPNKEYKCNWIFYEHMNFIHGTKKPRSSTYGNSSINDNNRGDNESNQVSKFYNMDNIKREPELGITPEMYLRDVDDNSPPTSVDVKPNFSGLNLAENPEPADDKPTTSNWKYTKRSYNQANLLEGLTKDEHKLIKSPRPDITDSNDMVHLTDSDYNFLVSFLPQMKKINVLQNLQFRTKVTNLMLNIMSLSTAEDTVSVSSPQNVNSNN